MSVFRFDRFELRCNERLLLKEGRPVALGSRAFDLLVALVERRDRLATKDELLAVAWRGLVVEEGNLMVQVSTLRKLLGASAIVTVTGRGYRFALEALAGPAGTSGGRASPGGPSPSGSSPAGGAAASAPLSPTSPTPPPPPSPPTATTHGAAADGVPTQVGALSAGSGPHDGVDDASAPARLSVLAPPRVRGNLPARLEPIFGRQADIEQLVALCRRRPLVTLCGAGGIGKTRLAAVVARELAAEHPDGVWVIELAAVRQPDLVVSTLAQRLGIAMPEPRPDAAAFVAALGERRAMLVLDNCEHVLATVADLASALISQAPALRILTTSQEPLKVPGEHLYRLAPLAVPLPGRRYRPEEFGAAQLFLERVRAQCPDLTFSEGDLDDSAVICRHLDGIALAIELAAARVPLLGIAGVRARLGDNLKLLSESAPLTWLRHQTMEAALEWSHSLLDEPTRVALRRLGIFTGGFSFEGAARVTGNGEGEDQDVLNELAVLVDRSLLLVEQTAKRTRYRMLEPMREFALARLQAAGETDAWRRRHALAMVAVCRLAVRERNSAWLWSELNNVRVALSWAVDAPGEGRIAVALATDTAVILAAAGHVPEAISNLQRVRPLLDQCDDTATIARFWQWFGRFGIEGRQPTSLCIQALRRSAAMFEGLGNTRHVHACRRMIAEALMRSGDLGQARAELALAEALEAPGSPAADRMRRLRVAGLIADAEDRPADALRLIRHALDIAEAYDIQRYCLMLMADLGWVQLRAGHFEQASTSLLALLDRMEPGSREGLVRAHALAGLTVALLATDAIDEAVRLAPSTMSALRGCGTLLARGDIFAWLVAVAGHADVAAQLIGAADALHASAEIKRDRVGELARDAARALIASTLSEADQVMLDRLGRATEEMVLVHLLERTINEEATTP